MNHFYKILCILCLCTNQLIAQQNISVKADKMALRQVVKLVEAQVPYTFLYDEQRISLNKRISLEVNGSLSTVLKAIERAAMVELQVSGKHILMKPSRTGLLLGRVIDEQGEPLQSVSVYLPTMDQRFITGENGEFRFHYPATKTRNELLTISLLGRQEQRLQVDLSPGEQRLPDVTLPILSMGLEEVSVAPTTDSRLESNSSIYINREVILQSGALSLNDLLNLVPGKKIEAPSLQRVQQANLRTANYATTSAASRDAFALNNAFGVALIMDGIAMSNNANMQTRNAGMTGMENANVFGSASGLKGGTNSPGNYSGDYAFGGLDLRQITTDNIESVEIVAGVASARYGDLTDGAIIINRMAGSSPLHFQMQLRDNATVYGMNKGFQTKKFGGFSFGANFTRSFEDNRDKLKAYDRWGGNAMWTIAGGRERAFTNTFTLDYNRNLDNILQDPDDPTGTFVRFRTYNFSVANRSNYRIDHGFISNIGLNMRYGQSYQNTYKEQLMNGTFVIYSDATEVGVAQGVYGPGTYTSVSHIEGKPIDFTTRLDLTGRYYTGDVAHQVQFGANYNYSKNNGAGQIVDPSRPNSLASAATAGNRSARYYDYTQIRAQQQIGLYAEDVFQIDLADRPLHVRAGARMDFFERFVTVSPRANLRYELNSKWRVGLAYGFSSKAPALAQLYPGPVYYEIPLFQYTAVTETGAVDAANSLYLLHVDKFVPRNNTLKPTKSQQLELSVVYAAQGFRLAMNVFDKSSYDGIGTFRSFEVTALDLYKSNPNPNAELPYVIDGKENYRLTRNEFVNGNKSKNRGVELLFSTPKWEPIQTVFNIRGGFTSSNAQTLQVMRDFTNPGTDPLYAVTGVYPARIRNTKVSNAALTSSTHIPKAKLLVNFTAEFNILNKTKTLATDGFPTGYYTERGEFVAIPTFDPTNTSYQHLLQTQELLNNQNQPGLYSNFHLNLSKEITERLTVSFNVYNVFNYRPQYLRSDNTLIIPNSKPTYGAQLRLRL
ncbi:TonB-dependent receptor [Sphingobacterium sp. lm-10]|uniref:TonB-dependent receptor n=1 Tax=Sphingobacterium sp. lm-10 TaxID=2944904 RepID=UPI002021BB65|nr:TonB-dependent receptor [Sphingobacterium sp. lm-10]MCL7986608.1 TonB-dependent receptor [Sphingobacterium sp. lm-10]